MDRSDAAYVGTRMMRIARRDEEMRTCEDVMKYDMQSASVTGKHAED